MTFSHAAFAASSSASVDPNMAKSVHSVVPSTRHRLVAIHERRVVQIVHVVHAPRCVFHRGFHRAEFGVVVLVVAGHVDHGHIRIEILGGPARAFGVIVDVAREHDEIRLGIGNGEAVRRIPDAGPTARESSCGVLLPAHYLAGVHQIVWIERGL